MDVVLLILKIIGIVLLSLIGLVILFMLAVFLWPFSYRIKAQKDANDFHAAARILWLLGLVTAHVIYDGKARLVVKVIGIPVYKVPIWPAEEKEAAVPERADADKALSETDADSSEKTMPDGTNENADVLSDDYVSEGEYFQDSMEDSEMLTDEEIDREIEEALADTSEEDAFDRLPFGKKIKAFIHKIKEFILKLREKCYNIQGSVEDFINKSKKKYKEIKYYYKLIRHPSVKPALLKLWKATKSLLRHIRPRRLKADIEFGTGDPASTMKVYGYYCMIYPFYGKQIRVEPDMENKFLRFDAKLSGRFQLFRFIWMGWSLFADRNVRKLIRLIRREVKRRGGK